MQHILLRTCYIHQDNEEIRERGIQCMETASENGDREAMLYMARAFDTGTGLTSER